MENKNSEKNKIIEEDKIENINDINYLIEDNQKTKEENQFKNNNNDIKNSNNNKLYKKISLFSFVDDKKNKNSYEKKIEENKDNQQLSIKSDKKNSIELKYEEKNLINNNYIDVKNINNNEDIYEFFEKCEIKIENNFYFGYLILKEFIINFVPDENCSKDFYNNLSKSIKYYEFNLNYISKIKNIQENKKIYIQVKLKDYRKFIFVYSESLNQSLKKCIPTKIQDYYSYALYYKKKCDKENKNFSINGWEIFSFDIEIIRQEIDCEKDFFQICKLNNNYNICSTYPNIFVIPFSFNESKLSELAFYRKKERIPILTYYLKKYKTSIWRSSQCKSGLKNKINKNDIEYINLINNQTKKDMIIYDARPYISALVNKINEGGIENIEEYNKKTFYRVKQINFCGIENIHFIRKSFKKIICFDPNINKKYLSFIESTKWLDTTSEILKSSYNIAKDLINKNNILIHCSDGWDRTSQLSSITQIILDPYFRTIYGFASLIEKDWISFGHQFAKRNGCSLEKKDEKDFSPIFIQFLDCVYQIIYQYPTAFEFNENLLLFLAEEVFSNKYGTFLFNSEKEKNDFNIKDKTISIWSDVFYNKEYYINLLYDDKFNSYLNIKYHVPYLKFWNNYFFKFDKIGIVYCKNYNLYRQDNINNKIKENYEFINDLINVIEENNLKNKLKDSTKTKLQFYKK